MSCEICGRNNCCKSFHSIEEQKEFNEYVQPLKDRMENKFNSLLKGLDKEEFDGIIYVPFDQVKDLIDELI